MCSLYESVDARSGCAMLQRTRLVICREGPDADARATLGQAIVRGHVAKCLAHCADMYTLSEAAQALARSAPSR